MNTVQVKTKSGVSTVYIGEGVLSARLPLLTHGQENFVVTDSNVYALHQDFFKTYFKDTEIFVLKAGEENKNFQSLGRILEQMTVAGMRRTSRLFAVGGGVVGDIGGLAASLYMRGIAYVQIPTTLLAQVDSSVGGKTAVDFCGVKNAVGSFYQPFEVLIDPCFLSTLSPRDVKSGLGEIVKYASLNSQIFRLLANNDTRWQQRAFLTELIEICVRHKASVVEADEKEEGIRKSLNVGHTTGHVIELASGMSHGESVLYGMLLETQMAIDCGVCEKEYGRRLLSMIGYALSLEPNNTFTDNELQMEKAKSDKKNTSDGNVICAVAKSEGEYSLLSMPYAEYRRAIKRAWERIESYVEE